MTHDHKHDHNHQHDHHRHHHDGHSHDHHHGDHHHDWQSQTYVTDWIARDAGRSGERKPILERLIAAVPYPHDSAIQVLDLGAGGGVVAEAVLNAFPNAHVTLQDFSSLMLDRARERLKARAGQLRFSVSDLKDPAWARTAGGPFDLAVSAIAIHNLYDLGVIAGCYEAVRGLLKPNGCFLDYDHFDRIGGVPLNQHSLRVAGFASVDIVWHEHPTAILKANA